MGKLMNWLLGEPMAQTAHLGMVTRPIVVNPGADEKLRHAAYRMDAIQRHCAQNKVSEPRMREFRTEIITHAALLHKEGLMNASDHDEIVKRFIGV